MAITTASAPANQIRFSKTAARVGAEILDIDLSQMLDEQTFIALRDAWFQHLVLLFRNQHLNNDMLLAFSRRFGEPDVAPPQEQAVCAPPGFPEIMIVSNVIENGSPIGNLGYTEAPWHTDMCYTARPPMASVLYAIEAPTSGGETNFMNMYAVYDALPGSLKLRITCLSIKHDSSYTAAGELRFGESPVSDVSQSPGAIHPLVRVHPDTGRKAVYLGRRRNAYVVGLSISESETLLDELWAYAIDPLNSWRHSWRAGDLIIWDNRCTMHKRESFPPDSRRIMYRTQIR
ncbi:MAG TPA: TauD/TfdA family dioxygenase [Pyrinomonadaceae bacterium]|nr:TauD/TfdA family dioxygenase [Pyrinomonadaceae bacterium]